MRLLMRYTRYACVLLLSVMLSNSLFAQNTRISDYNRIGWYNYLGTFKLGNGKDQTDLIVLEGKRGTFF